MLNRKNLQKIILPLAVFFILTLAMLSPAVFSASERIIGNNDNDIWFHVWGLWWTKTSLFSAKNSFCFSSLLNYPSGASIFVIDLLGSLAAQPLLAVFNLALSYNIIIFLLLYAAGLSSCRLAYYLTRNLPASITAGVVFETFPFINNQVEGAITETLHVATLPLFMLFFLKNMKQPTVSRTVLSAVFLTLAFLGTSYYGFSCLIFAGAYMFYSAFLGKRAGLNLKKISAAALIFAGVFLLLLPVKNKIEETMDSPRALFTRKSSESREFMLGELATDAKLYFRPLEKYWYNERNAAFRMMTVAYIGYVPVILAVLSLFNRNNRKRYFWFSSMLIFISLSGGLYAYWNRSFIDMLGYRPALPYMLLADNFGVMSKMANCLRYLVPAGAVLSVSAAWGFVYLLKKYGKSRKAKAVIMMIPLLIIFESLVLAPVKYPLSSASAKVPGIYYEMARDKDEYAVIELPSSEIMMGLRVYFYYQTVHGKKLPLLKAPGSLNNNLLYCYFNYFEPYKKYQVQKIVTNADFSRMRYVGAGDMEAAVRDLKGAGYKYIIWHFDLYERYNIIQRDKILAELKKFNLKAVITGDLAVLKLY